jgi:hypothetical protein
MENYWSKELPLISSGPIQLQTHGGQIRWKNIFVRAIPPEEANSILSQHGDQRFESVFNGQDFGGWLGPVDNYEIIDGTIRCKADHGGTIYTEREYGDFVARLEFLLPAGGNNGLAIRYPGQGDTAYDGMCELQILDDNHETYADLDPRQYHGSAYGMVAATRGYLRPPGQWNYQQVSVIGSKIRVELNGNKILDCDLQQVNEFLADQPHPGKSRERGHFGFAGHNSPVRFKNIRIKALNGIKAGD